MAEYEARRLTLGSPEAREQLAAAIRKARTQFDETVVIGGPPCQAYSLVGRARNRGVVGYRAEADHRHYLYRHYIEVLRELRPAAFVMENVKGILSAKVGGQRVFDMILEDLRSIGGNTDDQYDLVPLSPASLLADDPSDFLVQAEGYAVPQRRHRIIIVGVRRDVARRCWDTEGMPILRQAGRPTTVRDVIGGLPALRSGLSREPDDAEAWRTVVSEVAEFLADLPESVDGMLQAVERMLVELPERVATGSPRVRESVDPPRETPDAPAALIKFLRSPGLIGLAQHNSRVHMRSDLARYMFTAAFASAEGRSPKSREYPDDLAPDHGSWSTGGFADRFRAQLWDEPSTTITSHISKDGHYFIHPDPVQCRSLTVREAARLQTFPDDYLFLGNRTQQYIQVGNAVPPFLARQLAQLLHAILERASSAEQTIPVKSRKLVGQLP
jgi:DNA (cytosine-5)-methyltransferase 1